MRQYVYSWGLLGMCLLFSHTILHKDSISKKLPKKDRIDSAMAQELQMTEDPTTGSVPKKVLLEARNKYEELSSVKTASLDWESRGPLNVAGRTRAIIYDLNDSSGRTVFAAGVSGGLWKSTNIKSTNPNWKPVNDFFGSLAICAIAQDPSNPQIMFFGTGEGYFESDSNPGLGIWKSTNGGSTWNHLASTGSFNFQFIQDIKLDELGNIWVSTKSGLFKSSNSGSSWTKVLGSNNHSSTNTANRIQTSASSIYVTMGINEQDGIYKSSNSGSTWTKLSAGLPSTGYSRVEIALAPSNDQVLYALYEKDSDSSCLGIFKTVNGGTSWVEVTNPNAYGMDNFARTQAWYNLAIVVDPNDENKVTIGGIDLLNSTDGGTSWNQLSSWVKSSPFQYVHPDQHIITYNPFNAQEMLVGNDGGVWMSQNAGSSSSTFQAKNQGLNITQFYRAAMHPDQNSNYILAGAQDNGTQRFNKSGMNNTYEVTGGDGVSCFIDEDNPDIQITSYIFNNYFVSTDGGQNFTLIELNNYGFFANPNFYDSDQNILYASTSSGNILRWKNPENKVAAFQHIIVTKLNGQKVSFIKESPNVPNRIYVGTSKGDVMYIDGADNGIFKSATVLKDANVGYVSSIDIEIGNEDHLVMTYSNYGMESIFETTNGGSSWVNIEGNIPDMPIRDIMISPQNPLELIVATELGVWRSSDNRSSNITWYPENSNMANVRVDDLVYRPSDGTLGAATHGRGFYTTSLAASSTVPVDIVSFELQYDKAVQTVSLEWQIANEKNVDYYQVEKSFDGEVWDDIAQLPATNSPSLQTINYYDTDIYTLDNAYYYRIQIVDIDGQYRYSDWRSIYIESKEEIFEPSIYPNPFLDRVMIENVEKFKKFFIRDVKGQVASSLWVSSNGEVDLSSLKDGVYFLSWITHDGKTGVTKLVKQGDFREE